MHSKTSRLRSLLTVARSAYPESKKMRKTFVKQRIDLEDRGHYVVLPTSRVSARHCTVLV